MKVYLVSPSPDEESCWECGRIAHPVSAAFSTKELAENHVAKWGGDITEMQLDEDWFGGYCYGIEKYDKLDARVIPMPTEPQMMTDNMLMERHATRLWNCCWQFLAYGTTPEFAKEKAERLMKETLGES